MLKMGLVCGISYSLRFFGWRGFCRVRLCHSNFGFGDGQGRRGLGRLIHPLRGGVAPAGRVGFRGLIV